MLPGDGAVTALVWFRRDLRLDDHPALSAALGDHERVVPVYVHDPDAGDGWAPGAASRVWLHHSLAAFGEDIAERGGRLLLFKGSPAEALGRLADQAGADVVHVTRGIEPGARAEEDTVRQRLAADDVELRVFTGNEFTDLDAPRTNEGAPYRVFTPYWNALKPMLESAGCHPAPDMLPTVGDALRGTRLDTLGLLPAGDWADELIEHWEPGEAGARARLEEFESVYMSYDRRRDAMAEAGTSRLSPHLAFGELSPRRLLDTLERWDAERGHADRWPWVRQLAWREFGRYQLWHQPESANQAWNEDWADFPWADDDEDALERWRRGRTGVPLVDAAMRQLWATGWMHNRARMVVASFLAKNLGQHWLHGARWFWDTLVDADLANNTLGWQWTAGTGADAAPYFRVFNPVTQGQKHDPDADYVRRWVPELAGCDGDVHALLDGLDDAYPAAIVDLKESRQQALDRYQAWKDRRGGR